MGIFTQTKRIGSLTFEFYDQTEAAIISTLPPLSNLRSDEERVTVMSLPFMFIGKLLFNFPPQSGINALKDVLASLTPRMESGGSEQFNGSMLDIATEAPIKIVDHKGSGKWTYAAILDVKGITPAVETKIASGDEDHFHRASIALCCENLRRDVMKIFEGHEAEDRSGAVVCVWCYSFLKKLEEEGIANVLGSMDIAIQAGTLMTEDLMKV